MISNFFLKLLLSIAFNVKISSELYVSKIVHVPSIDMDYKQEKSAVFLLSSPKHLKNLVQRVKIMNSFPTKLKFIIYCKGLKVVEFLPPLGKYVNKYDFVEIENYGYFLQSSRDQFSLATINAFMENKCHQLQLETVDVFDKKTFVWKNELRSTEKFKNLNNCTIVYGYEIKKENASFRIAHNELLGFEFDFMKIMEVRGNFRTFFQPMNSINSNLKVSKRFPNHNYTLNVDFTLSVAAYVVGVLDFHITTTFDENDEIFVITPSEAYNSYEKLILPFDKDTWMYLIITFSSAFFLIFMMNFASQRAKGLVYGKNVNTPAFNVVSIFFGIGQTKLPNENFSRIILMFFIFFCLIVRTGYQGVQFDFLTRDMRRFGSYGIQNCCFKLQKSNFYACS
jgi:hypothetical protein